jgi:hypothetical protein
MKHRREMSLSSKPNAKRHITHRSQGVTEQHRRMMYALHRHELARGDPSIFPKLRRKMHSAQACGRCEVLQSNGFPDV